MNLDQMISYKPIREFFFKYYHYLLLPILVLIYVVPIIIGFFFISHYAVNVPYWDQWNTIVPSTIDWYAGTFDYHTFFEPQNDSRPILTNILMLFISVSTALDINAIFYAGFAIYIICILFIFYYVKKDIGMSSSTLLLLIPMVYYAFNLYYMVRFIHNLGALSYPVLIFTALASLYFLSESKTNSRRSNLCFLYSIGMGIACTFSFAAGLSIWFAGFIQLLIQKMHRKWEKIIVWTLSAISIFYIYFILLDFQTKGLHSTGAYISFIENTLRYPLDKFLCFMGTLGAEIIHDSKVALFFGILLFAIIIALLYVNRHSLELDRYSKWYGLLTFGMLTSLEVTLTRSGGLDYLDPVETIFFIPGPRHSLAIFLPIICIYILAIIYWKESVAQKKPGEKFSNLRLFLQAREFKNLFLLCIILLLLFGSIILHSTPGVSLAKAHHNQQLTYQYYLQNYADIPDDKLNLLCWDLQLVKSQAPLLEHYNLSIFVNPNPEPHLLRFYWLDPDIKTASGTGDLINTYFTKQPDVKINSISMPAIFEHPQGLSGTTIVYEDIKIHKQSIFEFDIGLDEKIWDKSENDGVTFEIYISNSESDLTHRIFSKTLNPVHEKNDRMWQHFEISLEKYVSENVSVQLVTRPNGNNNYDWAWWGDPKIIWAT